MLDEPLLDETTFHELQGAAGAEFTNELVGTFAEETPLMLVELHRSHDAGDADNFRRVAHSLKSNALTFGANRLAGLARTMELGGLATTNEQMLQELQAVCNDSLTALSALAAAAHG